MKSIVIIMLLVASSAMAQNQKATIDVRGNCDMCKARIEKAALKAKGVKYAVWQAETEELRLIYNTKKVLLNDVAQSIAAVGHEADGISAPDSVYAALPMCCKYESGNPHKAEDDMLMEHKSKEHK